MHYSEFIGVKVRKSYDPATSYSLALACKLAYEKKKSVINRIAEEWGFPNVSHVSVKKGKDIDTQCFVMSSDKHIIVVFRGSESLNDWFANFQTVYDPGPLKNTRVHEGFQDALFPAVISITNPSTACGMRIRKSGSPVTAWARRNARSTPPC
jgi:triacylglycerol lipase